EVPDSSWYTNRGYDQRLTDEQLRLGPCQQPLLEPVAPWTVVGAKPNGANPGFVMKAADGRRYVVKFDGTDQLERATAADVIGSKVYWAAGWFTPCNEVLFFDPSIIEIDPDATAEDEQGNEEPLT